MESEVIQIIESQVTMTTRHLGLRCQDNWWHDTWECYFLISPGLHEKEMTTEYRTGLAYRKLVPGVEKYKEKYLLRNEVAFTDVEAAQKGMTRPYPSFTSIEVLKSLADATSSIEMSFDSWCKEFGENPDSIKILNIYLACQKDADKIYNFLNHDLIQRLRELEI